MLVFLLIKCISLPPPLLLKPPISKSTNTAYLFLAKSLSSLHGGVTTREKKTRGTRDNLVSKILALKA